MCIYFKAWNYGDSLIAWKLNVLFDYSTAVLFQGEDRRRDMGYLQRISEADPTVYSVPWTAVSALVAAYPTLICKIDGSCCWF